MMKKLSRFLVSLLVLPAFMALAQEGDNPMVLFKTNKGDIEMELYPDQAPKTVENFIGYVDSGFYDGTVFHRVIPGFVIQGGGFESGMERKETKPPIVNESDNGLSNERGTLSMARLPDPDSATSQFFINLNNNANLDYNNGRAGYAVFARVVRGMEVVDAIAAGETASRGRFDDVPVEDVVIESATTLK